MVKESWLSHKCHWVNKAECDDAEKKYFLGLQGKNHGMVSSRQGSNALDVTNAAQYTNFDVSMQECEDNTVGTTLLSSSGGEDEEPTSLVDLTGDDLRYIAEFLRYNEVNELSDTCTAIKAELPYFKVIKGPVIREMGPHYGHWIPTVYFDGPKIQAPVKKLYLSLTWRDQGWGNRKGKIWIQLCKPIGQSTIEIIDEDKDIFDIAPHEEKTCKKALTQNNSIVKSALPGHFFRFMKNIGGGGGHQLHVRRFEAIIEM